MISIFIPGRGNIIIEHLAMDMNGTVALDGNMLPGVSKRLDYLKDSISIHLLTADTFGTAKDMGNILPYVDLFVLPVGSNGTAKMDFVNSIGAKRTVAIGNGYNDTKMFKIAILSIAVMGKEGLSTCLLNIADIFVCDIKDALDLLINSRRLIATLRE